MSIVLQFGLWATFKVAHNPQFGAYTCGSCILATRIKLLPMEIRLTEQTEAKLAELVDLSGRPANEIVEDAMAAYLTELEDVRNILNRRYDEWKTGKVSAIDGEEFFKRLQDR